MQQYQALHLWIGLPITMYARETLANLMAQRSPYMINDKVEGTCSQTYGAPNQAMALMSFILLSLYLQKYYEVGQPEVRFQSVMCTGYIIKMVL